MKTPLERSGGVFVCGFSNRFDKLNYRAGGMIEPHKRRRFIVGAAAAEMSRAILRVVVGVSVCIAALLAYFVVPQFIWPAAQASVPLPVPGVSARIEVWAHRWSGQYDLVVQNSFGELRVVMWEDWGPAQRSSLYLGPDNDLFVVGGGQLVMVVLESDAAPRLPHPKERGELDDAKWQHLGTVDRFDDGFRYASPSEQKECVDFFGEGVRVRVAYEAEISCN